ncbi:non-ribosomal peptide synthetase [Tumebacillus permanentifrigoris]|uniref:Acyl-CoA synthetase (AMP-forming)/AMP-acid ligase II n=1 Tax=Tumebacillus permanentifrigoris TaxID=378543 RepID=A0A316D337_9BACL|nr:non-ribosomal peptide synthetase [Tumebacillus permanentifrigoris]PWK05386.1 acyl-CoA synthetase (AMP-forming)/AMP-acid ligase II [Tumebacillus permanentifrigoris]
MKFRNLVEMLEARRASDKGLRFIRSDQDEVFVSYGNLYDRARGVLYHLQARGIKPGDEVLLQIENNESFLYVFWACLLGGYIPVPITVGSKEEHNLKVIRIWEVVNNPYLVTSEQRYAKLRSYAETKGFDAVVGQLEAGTLLLDDLNDWSQPGVVQYPEEQDVAFIQFSSGSTGDPKGVVLTHHNLLTNVGQMHVAFEMDAEDGLLSWVPYTHDMGMIIGHLTPINSGINQYNMDPMLFMRRPVLWFKKVNEHKVTIVCAPNFGYKLLLQSFQPEHGEGWDLSRFKVALNGAEPILAETMRAFEATFAPYGMRQGTSFSAYGLAEASVAVSFSPVGEGIREFFIDRTQLQVGQPVRFVEPTHPDAFSLVETGRPIIDLEMRICDEDNHVLPDNVIGYAQIRGANVTSGYYNNPEATARTITPDGWLNTGDLGFMREGRFLMTGRAKEIIIVQGQNYYPHDIERMVSQVPGVARGEAAACGVFNETLGYEEIHLFVLYKGKLDAFAEIALQVKQHIAQQLGLTLGDVLPLRQIPKTTSGKIQRFLLAEEYRSGEYDELAQTVRAQLAELMPAPAAGQDLEHTLLYIVREVLGVVEVGIHDNFTKFGATSLQMTKMQERLEQVFPGRVKVSDLFAFPSISMLVELIEGKGNLLLPAVRLPESYFHSTEERPNSGFEVRFDAELTTALTQIAAREQATVSDLLLALCANLFHQVSQQRMITLPTLMHSDEHVVAVTVDFEQVTGLQELIEYGKRQARDLQGDLVYARSDFSKIVRTRDPQAAVVCFCDRDVRPPDAGLLRYFDLLIERFEDGQGMGLFVEFNSRRLDKERVRQLAVNLVKLAKRLANGLA